jgi:hypothetical protein
MTRGDDFVDEAKKLVQYDVEQGFNDLLSSRTDAPFAFGLHESPLDDATTFATSEELVVLPWRYPCTHVGPFLDIPRTDADFELRGTTFVDIREDDPNAWRYYRYVDYIGALHQLGVPTVARRVIAPERPSEDPVVE